MGWRYIASRLNGDGTETFLDWNLPLSQVKFKDVLSGPSPLSAVIAPETSRLIIDGRPLLERWSTVIYPELDGDIRGGFIVSDFDVEDDQLTLDAIGFAGYPQGMAFVGDKAWPSVDALDVLRYVWSHLQTQPMGNIGMRLPAGLSGVKVGTAAEPFRLAEYTTHDLGKVMDDMSIASGFDYREKHTWDGEKIRHELVLGRPLGRRKSELRFALGENVSIAPKIEFDGDEYASEVIVLGAGEGSKMIRARAGRPDSRIRRTAVVTDKTLTTAAKAQGLANRELLARLGTENVSEIHVIEHPNAPIGSFEIGDDIAVLVGAGWSEATALWVRILAIAYSPESPDVATLSITRVDRISA